MEQDHTLDWCLNRINVRGGLIFICTPFETYFKEISMEVCMCSLKWEAS
jgi:hypothetical protein